ncbi:GrpB family protein [Streptomyces sp. NPDC056527]|uniref:GrpB family protein n=1 Tax=Streptomyces sp. NPDC056527 TaxID=3345853 RepID=UPI0036755C98
MPDTRRGTHPQGGEPFQIAPYDPACPAVFAIRGECLRAALGDAAPSIGHIGPTSVPGLTAKLVIDIQISVASLEPADPFLDPLTGMGLVHRADNAERTKRYFREPPGRPRTHVHVRQLGSFSRRFPLLFRDPPTPGPSTPAGSPATPTPEPGRRERMRKARDSARGLPENSEGGAGVVQSTWRGLDDTKAPGL